MFWTGRIDYLEYTSNEMMEFFKNFTDTYFTDGHFIFAYENKTKSGLPCKSHCHFWLELPSDKVKHATLRKKFRAWFSNEGFVGSSCSFKTTEDNDIIKAQDYILKQNNVIHTNLDAKEIDELILRSKRYNESIVDNTQNEFTKWRDHKQEIMEQLQQLLYMTKRTFLTRKELNQYICKYAYDWNLREDEHNKIILPTSEKLKQFINEIEDTLFSLELSTKLREIDFGQFISNKHFEEVYQRHESDKFIKNVNAIEDKKPHAKPKKTIKQLIEEQSSDSDSE